MIKTLPVLAVKSSALFPFAEIPIRAFRKASAAAVYRALQTQQEIFALPQINSKVEIKGKDDLATMGTLGKVTLLSEESTSAEGELEFHEESMSKGGPVVRFSGQKRYRLIDLFQEEGIWFARAIAFEFQKTPESQEQWRSIEPVVRESARRLFEELPQIQVKQQRKLESISDPEELIFWIAGRIEMSDVDQRRLLEAESLYLASSILIEILEKARGKIKLQREWREKLSDQFEKQQRESILREQLRMIQEELSQSGNSADGGAPKNYRQKVLASALPEQVEKVALEEVSRLESMGAQSPESHLIRNYLDLILSLPWAKPSDTKFNPVDLSRAKSILDQEHFGMEPIKQRILQHLGGMNLKKKLQGQVLLLVGPPGVGKTSLAQSIANAMDRKFSKISLGGVRDEAAIRGHRRTYVGALPGQLIQTLKRVKTDHPVILLDEMDKLGSSWSGDPTSALLEVLDPEQNTQFHDHYLDLPYDLSRIVFIATANSLEGIPRPLLDRCDVVEVNGYTIPEKLHIAEKHILPKVYEETGVRPEQLSWSESALEHLISEYTRESGVRDLRRKLLSLVRAQIPSLAEGSLETQPIQISREEIDRVLGSSLGGRSRVHAKMGQYSSPGVATGLAWTPVGGEILLIEAQKMPGKGNLKITGQLGEVMQESAWIAMSLIRSQWNSWGVGELPFQSDATDLHLHVPSGATPKDGPSAGVTLLTALASLCLDRMVPSDLAMTGEITLRGAVLAVGGIREKVTAAQRAGAKRVILPELNRRDYLEVPEEVRGQLDVVFVQDTSELLNAVFGEGTFKGVKPGSFIKSTSEVASQSA